MRSLALRNLWNWLPTFRVVAEQENIQAASRMMHVSPSAVSRTIRLLEAEVGRPLFSREAGRVQLTLAGKQLLEALRSSMRLMDDGVTSLQDANRRAPFYLTMGRELVRELGLPALALFRAQHADASLEVKQVPASEASARVQDGSIDVAVVAQPPVARAGHVELHLLGRLHFGVYCGARHPLFAVPGVGLEEIVEHPFIQSLEDPARFAEIWAPERGPRCGLTLPDAGQMVVACVEGLGLAILPLLLTRELEAAGRLRRLPSPPLAETNLYAVRRPQLVSNDLAANMIQALRARMQSLLGEQAPVAVAQQR